VISSFRRLKLILFILVHMDIRLMYRPTENAFLNSNIVQIPFHIELCGITMVLVIKVHEMHNKKLPVHLYIPFPKLLDGFRLNLILK
jgi:hypothetical protein